MDRNDSPEERGTLAVDRAKAKYIANTMLQAIVEHKEHKRTCLTSHVKVNVFSPLKQGRAQGGVHESVTSDDFQNMTSEVAIPSNKKKVVYSVAEQIQFKNRQPKAIVFSQHAADLQVSRCM